MTVLNKKLLLFFLMPAVLFIQKATAQNLFANPSFEDMNICVEFNASCAAEGWFYIKPTTNPLVNAKEAPRPYTGNNLLLVPVESVYGKKEFSAVYSHPFVYSMLCCPLVKGEKYLLSFFMNTSGRKFYGLDFCFTSIEPATDGFNMTQQKASFSIQLSEVGEMNEKGWAKVEHSFIATGEEKFCIIGNLSKIPWGFKAKDKMNSGGAVYYFLDELNLVSKDSLPLCKAYDINIKKMYAQNYRHTNFKLAERSIEDTIAETRQGPVFVTDTITIPAALFLTNSAVLKPAFTKMMDSLAAGLTLKRIAKIDIIGHTDDRGTIEKNIALSLARAESVKNHFATKLPQYSDIIFVSGKGKEMPVADNATEQGRMKNRRVEIIFTFSKMLTKP